MEVRIFLKSFVWKNTKEPDVVDKCQRWWVLRSNNQARSEGGLGIVTEALNFEKISFPRIGVGHLGSMRK